MGRTGACAAGIVPDLSVNGRQTRRMPGLFLSCLAVMAASLVGCSLGALPASLDWPVFGWDVGHSSAPPRGGLAENAIATLRLQQVSLDGTVDGTAIYLHGVSIGGAVHDALFVTTTYGKTIAVDADSGIVLWEYTPPSYDALKGTYRITNATPVADDDRQFIYAASPDGVVRKLTVSAGAVVWSTAITRLPEREKIASPLSFFHGKVIAATNGYIGDAPPYQGHVAILDAASGSLLHVWNSLCSDRPGLIDPASCAQSDSGIWGRAGVVIDSSSGSLYVATGNALWDGSLYWGDSVIELNGDATQVLGNYTPANTSQLDAEDLDLGSTSPVLLGGGLLAQGGKDGIVRILDWSRMKGSSPHLGGEASQVPTPGGDLLFTAPAVAHTGGQTWLYVADNSGTAAWRLVGTSLQLQWQASRPGTSPVVTDGLLVVYDPGGHLVVYRAATGTVVADLTCGTGHWNSPIVADGRIVLPEGNANEHLTSGTLDIWRMP